MGNGPKLILVALLVAAAIALLKLSSKTPHGAGESTIQRSGAETPQELSVLEPLEIEESGARGAIVDEGRGEVDPESEPLRSLPANRIMLRIRSAGDGRSIPGIRVIEITQEPMSVEERTASASGELLVSKGETTSYSISAPGHEPREVHPLVDPVGDVLEVRLSEYVRLEGRVAARDGRIVILAGGHDLETKEPESVILGRARMLEEGAWIADSVVIPHDMPALEGVRVELQGKRETRILADGLRLAHGDSIFVDDRWSAADPKTIRLRYGSGARLGPNIHVRLLQGSMGVSATTDGRGEVRFSALPAGLWQCELSPSGSFSHVARAPLRVDAKGTVDLTINGFDQISGTVELTPDRRKDDAGAGRRSRPVHLARGFILLQAPDFARFESTDKSFRFDLVPMGSELQLKWSPLANLLTEEGQVVDAIEVVVRAGDTNVLLRPELDQSLRIRVKRRGDIDFTGERLGPRVPR